MSATDSVAIIGTGGVDTLVDGGENVGSVQAAVIDLRTDVFAVDDFLRGHPAPTTLHRRSIGG